MDLLARAQELERQGRSVIHLEVGEPDFATPASICQAAHDALARGLTKYTAATGLPQLKQAISQDYARRYGVSVDSRNIVITPGASGALLLVLAALLESGDKILLTDPGYPCNRNFAALFEAETVAVPLSMHTGYRLTVEHLQQYWDDAVRVVLLASPANPTGAVMSAQDTAAIHAFCRQHGAVLVMDEIYQGLVYGQPAATALSLDPEIIVINSFSKYFCMTGWRLGWLVAPPAAVPALDRLAQNLFLAASTPAQYAALAALSPGTREILEAQRAELAARRDYLLPALEALGLRVPVAPDGAFYVYGDCTDWLARTGQADSMALARTLLEEAGVAVTPGADFGHHQAGHHLRFAFTTALARLREGVARLAAFL